MLKLLSLTLGMETVTRRDREIKGRREQERESERKSERKTGREEGRVGGETSREKGTFPEGKHKSGSVRTMGCEVQGGGAGDKA